MLNQEERTLLLTIARHAIEGRKSNGINVPESLLQKRGVFVTLKKEGKLRGCVGMVKPEVPLREAVNHCANDAAFHDTRFIPLTNDEKEQITIEISILSQLTPLMYHSTHDLIDKLSFHPGVLITKEEHTALYLPQVWKHVSSEEEFLDTLCVKAGLEERAWRSGQLLVETFTVEEFSDERL